MTLVLDASMALAWVFERQNPQEALRADRLLAACGQQPWLVPGLWHLEIVNALAVGERRGAIDAERVDDFLARLAALPILTDPSAPGERRHRLLSLAREQGLTAYDAAYLELALRLDADLASFDGPLNAAAHRAGTELVL